MRLESLTFNKGPSEDDPDLEIELGTMTILVGPNFSGKSLTLSEIYDTATTQHPKLQVLQKVTFSFEDFETYTGHFEDRKYHESGAADQWSIPVVSATGQNSHLQFNVRSLEVYCDQASNDADLETAIHARTNLAALIGRYFCVLLDGATRLNLVKPQPRGNLQAEPQNHFQTLFLNDELRADFRGLIYDAFGQYPVIDVSENSTNLRLKLSQFPPKSNSWERSLRNTVLEFMKESRPEEKFSDGVRAYVGLLAAAEALHQTLFLIDEPEAFLHPTLTKSLARHLCNAAKKKARRIIVATHSAEFVLGCLEVLPSDTKIVRLTYNGNLATTRELPQQALTRFTTTPLLRSTNSIQGLFNKSVVVCEGDSDRVIYNELIYRLQKISGNDSTPFEDNLLICSHGWKSAYKIVGALGQVGIPSAYLFDFDTICMKKSESAGWKRSWKDILQYAVPIPSSRTKLYKRIVEVGTNLSNYSRSSLKSQGLSFPDLSASDHDSAKKLIQILEKRGIFVSKFGCLESALVNYGISSSAKAKSDYVERALNGLGDAEDKNGYVKPSRDEVWQLLRRINRWIESFESGD